MNESMYPGSKYTNSDNFVNGIDDSIWFYRMNFLGRQIVRSKNLVLTKKVVMLFVFCDKMGSRKDGVQCRQVRASI